MSELTKHQKFKITRIKREDINEAPYNPRYITDENDKNLNKIIKKYGLVETLVWNKRTGNLVSGHQRIRQIDSMEKSDDYQIDVAEIDVDEETEIKLNLVLNNTSLMGDYDKEKLKEIKAEFPNINFLNDVGFNKNDIEFLDLQEYNPEMVKEKPVVQIDNIRANEIKNQSRRDYKEFINNNAGNAAEPFRNDFILTISFEGNNKKWEFMRGIGRNEKEKFLKYEDFIDIIKEEYRV